MRNEVLRDGARVAIRALEPADEAALRAAFRSLSPAARYQRFLIHVADLDERMWRYLCGSVDGHDHIALAAFEETGDIVGIVRVFREPGEPAVGELAIVVTDAWQRRGLGTLLATRIAELASRAGITAFYAHTLAENAGIHRLMARLGTIASAKTPDYVLRVQLAPAA